MLAGFRIPPVDEVAGAELGAGNAGDQHAVGDQGRHRHRISGFEVDRVLAPQLLAGLGIERDHVGVERGAKDLAVIQRAAAVDDAAADDARSFRRILDLRLPDLPPGFGVDRHRGAVGGDVKNALVDQRLGFFAAIVVEAVVPHRDQAFHGVFVDLLQRAETLQMVAHSVVENVTGIGSALYQFDRPSVPSRLVQITSPTRRPTMGSSWSSLPWSTFFGHRHRGSPTCCCCTFNPGPPAGECPARGHNPILRPRALRPSRRRADDPYGIFYIATAQMCARVL